MLIKGLIYFLLRQLTAIIFFLNKICYPCSDFKSKGIALFSLKLKGSVSIDIKSGYIIKSKIIINGKNNIFIFDDNVKISNCTFLIKGDNCLLDFRGARNMFGSRFELLDSNTKLIVNNNTGFNKDRLVIAGVSNEVNIGSNCIFAENVEVWASDTHSVLDTNSNKRINQDRPIFIGDRVWLGNRALIQKGVCIGNDVVIAAGSIVTKDIANNTLVAGVPAVPIKNNIKWDINRL
jgi:acetyltransferase-like isoleucine patch superfamily enzyme